MIASLTVGLTLLAIAIWLSVKNAAAAKSIELDKLSEEEADFFRRQVRRRKQVNVMLGLVGGMIAVSNWIPDDNLVQIAYWAAATLLVFWCALLALADMANIRLYYQLLQNQQLQSHADFVKRAREELKADPRLKDEL